MKTFFLILFLSMVSIFGYSQVVPNNNIDVRVPNAFTPDGDGLNDVFYPFVWGHKSLSFQVYNRLGQLVHNDIDASGWDGKVHENYCEQGVYVWKLCVFDQFDIPHYYYGIVTLLKVK